MFEPFGPRIWTMDGDLVRMFGVIPFTTRMTIIQLESGGLWLHSPIAPTPVRVEAVRALGPIEHLVAPNKIHSLGIEPWQKECPEARTFVSPAFSDRHPGIRADGTVTDGQRFAWSGEIEHRVIAGHAVLDEVVFFHQASRALIVTDTIQRHFERGDPWFWRAVKRFAGILGEQGGSPLDFKWSVRDRQAMRRAVAEVLEWDFDTLILSHGYCVRSGAKSVVAKAFDWLLAA